MSMRPRLVFFLPLTLIVAGAMQWVSAQAPAKAGLITRTYSVADLVVPLDGPTKESGSGTRKTRENDLREMIVRGIDSESWSANGGQGIIEYFAPSMALVVSQTPEVHEKINELLASLRRMQDVEVAADVRLVNVTEDCFGNLAEKFALPREKNDPVFLNPKQVKQLLELAQADAQTSVMAAPKLMMLNGQQSKIEVGENHSFVTGLDLRWSNDNVVAVPHTTELRTGFVMSLQPVASADHRFVRMALEASLCEVSDFVPMKPVGMILPGSSKEGTEDEPVTFTQFLQKPSLNTMMTATTLCVPDGGTALLCGWKRAREVNKDCGIPILAGLPFVGELFVTRKCEKRVDRVLLMVTPRIKVAQAEAKESADGHCPFPKEASAKAAPCPVPVGTVMDNLVKLEKARAALERAEGYRRMGQPKAARRMYEEVCKLCPGSACAATAEACLKRMAALDAARAEAAHALPGRKKRKCCRLPRRQRQCLAGLPLPTRSPFSSKIITRPAPRAGWPKRTSWRTVL
jgi:hypothetical protein